MPEILPQALEQALTMPVEEQVRRNQLLQERLRRYNVNRWAEDFIQTLVSTQKTEAARRARSLTGKAQAALVQQYRVGAAAGSAAGLRRHAGAVCGQPQAGAARSGSCWSCWRAGAPTRRTRWLIVSGRPRRDLEEWFGHLPVALVAEHGVWLRPKGGEWRMLKAITTEWKERVRPILQLYVDRLPGALLEEKEFSLAWHYRRADPEQASHARQGTAR